MTVLSMDDFQRMAAVISAAFPTFKLDMSNDVAVKVWYDNLKDIDSKTLAYATKMIISTSEFPPSIATIRKMCAEINTPEKVENEEGWGLVMRAIRNYGYMRSSEALESLPSQVQKAVMFVGGFQAICESENQDVIRGQFNKAMASVNTRTKANAQMGDNLLTQLTKIHQIAELKEKELLASEEHKTNDREAKKEIALAGIQNIRDILNSVGEQNNG